ncbi:urocanate hydratase [Desulfosporosinus sp. OT]|nr:urocanate hydratase [Desulfosporosinus sp. OT]
MLLNVLHPDVAEKWQDLLVYGGTGKAARNVESLDTIIHALKNLKDDETLLIQSGKAVGVIQSHPEAARVLVTSSHLVPSHATWEEFRRLEGCGLTMYGQSTAASWAYIGMQGVLQGTCDTFGELADQHFNGSLKGKIVLSSGLGGMGSAQPLAVEMHGGVAIIVEVNPDKVIRRLRNSQVEVATDSLEKAWQLAREYADNGQPVSIALMGNAAEIYPQCLRENKLPDVVTDQTAAHDLLAGYIPASLSPGKAIELRLRDPERYLAMSLDSIARHGQAMLEFAQKGAIVFDYGNNIRGQAEKAGVKDIWSIPSFVNAFLRPVLSVGKGPIRWVALSGNPKDIYRLDKALLKRWPEEEHLARWIRFVQERVHFQGLPARGCWLNYTQRIALSEMISELVRNGELSGPIAVTRDHLDGGSVAAPHRETEGMLDGSDAIADWPILNALTNATCGADLVSLQHGGGVGIGESIHAGMTVIIDGTDSAERRGNRVLKADPSMGIIRHADAGYEGAIQASQRLGLRPWDDKR